MVEINIQKITSSSFLVTGVILISSGIWGIPQIPREEVVVMMFGLLFVISGVYYTVHG